MPTLHFGPTSITEYVDGYTIAGGSACGARHLTDTESDPKLLDRVTWHPLQVTCKHCVKTSVYKGAKERHERQGTLLTMPVNFVPRMRNAVFNKPSLFNVIANNEIRLRLDLDLVFPDSRKIEILRRFELEKRREYSARRVQRLKDLFDDAGEESRRLAQEILPNKGQI